MLRPFSSTMPPCTRWQVPPLIQDGDILLRNGRIIEVGRGLIAPADATSDRSATAARLRRYFLPALRRLGLEEISLEDSTVDQALQLAKMRPEFDVTLAYNPPLGFGSGHPHRRLWLDLAQRQPQRQHHRRPGARSCLSMEVSIHSCPARSCSSDWAPKPALSAAIRAQRSSCC